MKKNEPTLGDISNQLTLLSEQMKGQFAEVNRHLSDHDQRFDEIDQRFEVVDQRFDKLDDKIDSLAIITNKHFILFDNRLRKVEYETAG